MASESRKMCNHALATLRRHFPADSLLCAECAMCPLLRRVEEMVFDCEFAAGPVGVRAHPIVGTASRKRRVALLLEDVSVRSTTIPAGEQVLLDRQQNAGTHLWVRARNTGFGRLGKFLVNRTSLDLRGPLTRVYCRGPVEKKNRHAVYISGVWYPLTEIHGMADADGNFLTATDLRAGVWVEWMAISEWVALWKGLV